VNVPVTDELIEMRGLRFHYRDWPSKKPGAPDLVLLHGFTGHVRSWDAFAEAMTDRYRVLALDQRGHGETTWSPDEKYGHDEMAKDLEAFVKAMGLKNFTLLGLSMGGLVSIEYAGKKPKELSALVIVDIGPELVASGMQRIRTGVQTKDVFASKEEAFEQAKKANPRPPEAHHRHRSDHALMRTGNGPIAMTARCAATPVRAMSRARRDGNPAPTSRCRRRSSAASSPTSSRPRLPSAW
jgi:pimeloyl-ACP methyl ester carboxylesterase